jgi:hypothetical protein
MRPGHGRCTMHPAASRAWARRRGDQFHATSGSSPDQRAPGMALKGRAPPTPESKNARHLNARPCGPPDRQCPRRCQAAPPSSNAPELSFAAPPAKGSGHVGSGRFIIRDGSLSSAAGKARQPWTASGAAPHRLCFRRIREARIAGLGDGRAADAQATSAVAGAGLRPIGPTPKEKDDAGRKIDPSLAGISCRRWPAAGTSVPVAG